MKTRHYMLYVVLLALFITGCESIKDEWEEITGSSPSPTPTPSIIRPVPTPVPTPQFCSGNELVCLHTMTRDLVRAQGGRPVKAKFNSGAFSPEPEGGLVFPLSLNTNRPIVIEFDVRGPILPKYTLPELGGGKVALMAFKGSNYMMTLQRMHGGYRNSDGVFRLMYGAESNPAIVITLGGFSGHYSTANWRSGEIHHVTIRLQQGGIQLSVDGYTSKKAQVRSSISGNKQVGFVLGNRAEDKMGAGQAAQTEFLNLKITN